jgi:hypothetical protein
MQGSGTELIVQSPANRARLNQACQVLCFVSSGGGANALMLTYRAQ